ncbi:MAG TPA: type 1 glutamine amidotransferase, partial [Cryptosporangiaceae bacterium]|nr:type 1 glutamine amidotransferase [Cryptosporangiaceae bacterium]
MTAPRLLVVENDPADGVCRLGDWLDEAGAELEIVRPYAGDPLPSAPQGHAGLVVLGGDQAAYDDADGAPSAPWFPALKSLLRGAVAGAMPTLGVCLGGQLLAEATGGRVERGTHPEVGASLVARRDAAVGDPLFAGVPFTPDVYQWHRDEIVQLPPGAVLLAASVQVPHQAFRLGDRAWGLQFHVECDLAMLASWAH